MGLSLSQEMSGAAWLTLREVEKIVVSLDSPLWSRVEGTYLLLEVSKTYLGGLQCRDYSQQCVYLHKPTNAYYLFRWTSRDGRDIRVKLNKAMGDKYQPKRVFMFPVSGEQQYPVDMDPLVPALRETPAEALQEIRLRAVRAGLHLLSEDEVLAEVARRRAGGEESEADKSKGAD